MGQDTWQGRTPHTTVLDLSSTLLVEGTNSLILKALPERHRRIQPVVRKRLRHHATRASMWPAAAPSSSHANSNAVITVAGFSCSAITVLDVTDPKQPAVVQKLTIIPSGAGYSASFVPRNPQGRYVAFQPGVGASAASLRPGTGRRLVQSAPTPRITSSSRLIAWPMGLARLPLTASKRACDAAVARLDQVYNEFSYGIPSPLRHQALPGHRSQPVVGEAALRRPHR